MMNHTNITSKLFLGAERRGTCASRRSFVCNGDILVDGRLENIGVLNWLWELRQHK